jgi:DNA polymerase-1
MGEMETSYGMPVTGTYGFLNGLFSIIDKYKVDCVVPAFDRGGNWRKNEDDSYKANRHSSDAAHKADISLLLQDVLPALGFSPIGVQGFEADDIISTISRSSSAFSEVYILTCDRDLFQLVNDKVKVILFSSAKKIQLVGPDEVVEHFGVFPEEVKFFKALSGDSSDNVAGLKGIGPKTAVKIIEECRTSQINPDLSIADRICLHPKVRDNSGTFLANLRLVSLDNPVPNLRWYASSTPQEGVVRALFEQLEFKSYLKDSRFKKVMKALNSVGKETGKV